MGQWGLGFRIYVSPWGPLRSGGPRYFFIKTNLSLYYIGIGLIDEEDAGAESSDDDADLGPLMRLGAVMRDGAAGLVPEPEPEPEDDLDDDDASGFAAL